MPVLRSPSASFFRPCFLSPRPSLEVASQRRCCDVSVALHVNGTQRRREHSVLRRKSLFYSLQSVPHFSGSHRLYQGPNCSTAIFCICREGCVAKDHVSHPAPAHPASQNMPARQTGFFPAIVRKVAAGEGDNPDTYILIEKSAVLLKNGVGLRLYTRESLTYTHLAWVTVVRTRVAERDYVEFILRCSGRDDDELRGSYHLLLADRAWTIEGCSMRSLGRKLSATMKNLWRKGMCTSDESIPRFIPPTPVSSSVPPSTQRGSFASLTFTLSSIDVEQRARPSTTPVLTVSNRRSLENDASGPTAVQLSLNAGQNGGDM